MLIMKNKATATTTTTTMKSVSPSESGFATMGSGSGQLSRLGLITKNKNARRRKLRIQRLKYTCQANERCFKRKEGNNDHEEAKERLTELSLSVSYSSSSSSENSSENGGVLSDFEEKKTAGGLERVTCVSHGWVSMKGRRREMEDAVRAEVGLTVNGGGDSTQFDFFGVYDGHGGSRVAEACRERLHRVLVDMIAEDQKKQGGCDGGCNNININIVWERVMEESFKRMDEEVNRGRVREEMVGSTAVVAVVGKEELVVANCGDSRAVLSRGGVAVPLSVDHKPDRADELRRVEAAGGRVINWNGHRILGVLATSRSIGDQYLKPFVIPKPEVTVSERSEEDEFIIVASDGLWDVVSNEVACQVVRKCFNGRIKWACPDFVNGTRSAHAATVLADLAMSRGSTDNISVIVVDLTKPNHFPTHYK